MRLILLVRKLQSSQMSILHRFDEVRALTAVVTSFRGGFQDLDRRLDKASEAFERMELGLTEGFAKLEPPEVAAEKVEVFDEGVARLEAIAQHLGELAYESAHDARSEELGATLVCLQQLAASFEGVAERLEDAAVSQLPPGAVAGSPAAPPGPSEPVDASEAGRLREALRASELARHELESRHAQELSDMADHARASAQRLEDDVKKKKRGLSELTQQNIALQNEVRRLRAELEAASKAPERLVPALPAEVGKRASLTPLFDPGEEGRTYGKEHPVDARTAAEQGDDGESDEAGPALPTGSRAAHEEPDGPAAVDEEAAGTTRKTSSRARGSRKKRSDEG